MTQSLTRADRTDRRIQLDISERLALELEQMKRDGEIATTKELLNNSLTALQWMMEQVKAGRIIVSVDRAKNDPEIFWMPVLRAAARARTNGD